MDNDETADCPLILTPKNPHIYYSLDSDVCFLYSRDLVYLMNWLIKKSFIRQDVGKQKIKKSNLIDVAYTGLH